MPVYEAIKPFCIVLLSWRLLTVMLVG